MTDKVREAASDAVDQLREPAQDAAASVKEAATHAVANVKDQGASAKSDVQGQVQDSKETVKDSASSWSRRMSAGPGCLSDPPTQPWSLAMRRDGCEVTAVRRQARAGSAGARDRAVEPPIGRNATEAMSAAAGAD